MSKSKPNSSFEEQVRQAMKTPDPRPQFIEQMNDILQQRAAQPSRPARRYFGLRPAWAVAIVILIGVIVATLVIGPQRVVAAFRSWLGLADPGLQSVQDAGLVTELKITAQPTLLPTLTATGVPPTAAPLELSQEVSGVTLILDWVYIDEGRLALGWTSNPLPEGLEFGLPQVTLKGVTPLQMQGMSQSFRSAGDQMTYVAYQVIHADEVDGKVSLAIDVPLIQRVDDQQQLVGNYHFEVQDAPVLAGQTLSVQQTYAVRNHGVEVRLKSVRITPSFTEVVACYDFPDQTAPFWYMQHATLQVGNGPEESYRPYEYLREITDDHCVRLGFAVGNAGGEQQLYFRVRQFVVPLTMQDELPAERIAAANLALAPYGIEIKPAPADQSEGPGGWQFVRRPEGNTDPAKDPNLLVLHALEQKLDGLWEFYVEIPTGDLLPGQATATPAIKPTAVGEQSVAGVTISLDWVFADVKRMAFGFTISGLPDNPDALALSGRVEVKDRQGNQVGGEFGGGATIQRLDGQPGTVLGSWSSLLESPLEPGQATFTIDITLDGSQGYDWNNIIGSFPVPAEATPYPPGVLPPVLPDRLVGTFHFEATTTVYPMQVVKLDQAVTANGITLRLVKAEMTPSYAQFTVCYIKPSAKDWMIGGQATLKSGDYEASLFEYGLLLDPEIGPVSKLPGEGEIQPLPGERCVKISFLLGHSAEQAAMTLTIPTLEQSMPEVIPDAEIKAAQEKLKAQGIELDYSTYSAAGGGGGGGPTFTKLPEGMTQAEAYQKFMEALGYVYTGPWVFTISQ